MDDEFVPSGPFELRRGFRPRPGITHAVFDFDGTISWLRHGWPGIMAGLFREHLQPIPGQSEAAHRAFLMDELLALNGKPTLFQMKRFVEIAEHRNVKVPPAEELLDEYQRRLDEKIAERALLIKSGRAAPDSFLIHGVRRLLELLKARGITLAILSGTIEPRVREEAMMLKVDSFFEPHIYGSSEGSVHFSKLDILNRILRETGSNGAQLLAFGDGPVEIEFAKQLGGVAVAVCSDEEINGSGVIDQFKRKQLVSAGADVVIADYRQPELLLKILMG